VKEIYAVLNEKQGNTRKDMEAGLLDLNSGAQSTWDESATRKFGKNCKNKKKRCYYEQKTNSRICKAAALSPNSILIVAFGIYCLLYQGL
jgi:hypothetical protein